MIASATNSRFPTKQFQVIDAGSTRRDLASRREVKYALPGADVAKLRGLLDGNCRRLIHNERTSLVRSIYFDDPRMSACRANLDGIGRRRKLRLRWYDSLKPEMDFFFEVKWRRNLVTGKHRLQMKSDEPLRDLSYAQIASRLQAGVPHELQRELHKYCEPVVIVQYRREHFATDDGSLRVTLDYDVTFYDQTGRQYISTAFARRYDSLVVLEGKTPVGREAELRGLLYPFAPRIGRCSKYVHGCRLLGLIRNSEL